VKHRLQQLGHLLGPGLVFLFVGISQFTQVMGIAQGVLA
jgi:hypothetical protein